MRLHFTLLFPSGNTFGWHTELFQRDSATKRITPREFYCFHLMQRTEIPNFLQRSCRLFQEFLLSGWMLTESQRLHYQRTHQDTLRADKYKNVQAAVRNPNNDDNIQIGRKVLASSFTGGPRWYTGKYEDAMALVKEFNKPDYFITMTTNPEWPEIKNSLSDDQKPQDRPDIVSRVFNLKLKQLLNDLISGSAFGQVVAHLAVVEWQKRGLPHSHILLIMSNQDKPKSSEDVDKVITAELPPNPNTAQIPELQDQLERLQETVVNNMLHGPCGTLNPGSICTVDGKCSKNFPKPYQPQTIFDSDKSHPVYRRRTQEQGGGEIMKRGKKYTNADVVPYNPFLLLRYNCHINVEVCSSPLSCKYLYKYVTKGSDRAMVATSDSERNGPEDEIKRYEDLRSVGSCEASHRLFDFPIAYSAPPVQRLPVHLENEQTVYFADGQEEQVIENVHATELTAFFSFNQEQKIALGNAYNPMQMSSYLKMAKFHTYVKKDKIWKPRERNLNTVVGRIYRISPLSGNNITLILCTTLCLDQSLLEEHCW